MKNKLYFLMIFFGLFFYFFLVSSVYAAPYDNLDSRIEQNNKFINDSYKIGNQNMASYADKYLRGMPEVDSTGFSKEQLSKITDLANSIVLTSDTDYQKLEKFYDWILDHYYYYDSPWRIDSLSSDKNYDNPYYLFALEYEDTGSIRARDNGFASMLVALARSQGISTRVVQGYYNKDVRDDYSEWGEEVSQNSVNHVWIQAYASGKWIMMDPVADCYKFYDDETDSYDTSLYLDDYQKRYFDPSVEDLSKTHIAFKAYSSLPTYKHITDGFERTKISNFLNYSSNGIKVIDIYDPNDSSTWFGLWDYGSKVNSSGHVTSIHWPNNAGLAGEVNFSYFTKLNYLGINNNKLTGVVLFYNADLDTVSVANNDIKYVLIRNAKKLKHVNALNNPATKIEYNFANGSRKAVITSNGCGTISAKYDLVGRRHIHVLKAKANSGCSFQGWYQKGKRVSKSANISMNRSTNFNYVAKFVYTKGTRIEVSISKQKLWYYKNGTLKYTSNVVTGNKKGYATPKGTYKIKSKARNTYLVGREYRSFVYYWMLFDSKNQIGLHDATWRSRFGGNIYTYNGSHGCVNLPYNAAKYIYNNVPVGTTVKIIN